MSQVSTLPSSSALNHSSGPSTTMPPDSSTDPAELLRRAALSSRKLKRRKLNETAPLSRPLSRPFVSTPSISLDYGQEEPSSMSSTPQQPPTPVLARAPTPAEALTPSSPPRPVQRDGSSGTAARTPLDDDASMREEGEISDNEDPPFRLPSKPIPPPITVTAAVYSDVELEASGSVHSPSFGVVSRSPSVKTEDACQHAVSSAYVVTTPLTRANMEAHSDAPEPTETFRLETPLYVLDHDHVRPGLSLTQRQYDTAKGVILDILGYGVPPEYLIDCGISREIIYYVFTELNLRLPSNLNTVGIPPYPPAPDVIASILLSQSALPLSPSVTSGPSADDNVTRPGSVGHGMHSPYPPTPRDTASTTVPQAVAAASVDSSVSASVLALSESTLTAIERQRKQELLARKAVQATMKRKEPVSVSVTQASAPSTTTVFIGSDISAKSSASAVSVEDFFNSIELPPSDEDSKGDPIAVKAPGSMKQSSPEPMSVDESIPGFGRNGFSEYDQPQAGPAVNRASVPLHSENKSLSRSASAPERSLHTEWEKELPTHKVSRAPENLPTRPRSDGTPAPNDNEGDSRRSSTTPQPTASIPRRGTKRPVAADFDSEPLPKAYTPPALSRTGSGAGFGNGAAYHPNPHVRRKMNGVATGGFASLNSARRCVIDVSDSEDDTSEDETPSTAGVPRETLSSARDSALALELEIERMRKIIREREEMKLRKQAIASSRSTPVSRESPAVSRHEGETAASSSAMRDEIPRSHNGNAKSSENAVLLATSVPSEPHSDVNSPISSTPSPPGSPPLSPYQDTSSNAQVAVHAALTGHYQSATPADGDQAIGGPALAAEPRQESAASSRASTPHFAGPVLSRHSPEIGPGLESVDIDASAQVSNRSHVMTKSSFSAYNSVLSHYPSLGGSLGLQEMVDMPNLESLKVLATARRITDSGFENGRICQFEVPGGGECRDEACGDVHLSLLQVDPHDEEVARYLCQDQNVGQMVQALQAARTRRPETSFDERVKEAWASTRVQWTQDKT